MCSFMLICQCCFAIVSFIKESYLLTYLIIMIIICIFLSQCEVITLEPMEAQVR